MNADPIAKAKSIAELQEQARYWWVRVNGGRMDAIEQSQFQTWLNANPQHKLAFEDINGLWRELDGIKDLIADVIPTTQPKLRRIVRWLWGNLKPSPEGEGWVRGNLEKEKRLFSPHPDLLPKVEGVRALKPTALIVILATCCLLFVLVNPMTLRLRADESTDIAETRTVQLTDGSSVQMNSDTALSINITPTTRELNLLQGEALFKVSPDPNRPFQVRVGNVIVTALGTAFNIRHSSQSTEVTVTEHSVAVKLDGSPVNRHAQAIVSQGQQVSYENENGLSAIKIVDTRITTAWQRGKLVFQDKPLGDVIAELNHYHRGYFVVADPTIAQRRVNGVFNTDNPIAALNAIEKFQHLHSNRLSHYLVLLHR